LIPLALLLAKDLASVDQDLTVFRKRHFESLEGSRGGPLEIHASPVEPTAVARALEFVFRGAPDGSAPEMSASHLEGIKIPRVVSDQNGFVLFLPLGADCAGRILIGKSGFKGQWGLINDPGEEKPNTSSQKSQAGGAECCPTREG